MPRTDQAVHRENGSEMSPCLPYWISLYSCVCFAGTTVDFSAVSLATCFSVQHSKIWAEENSLLATHLTVSKRELCVEAFHIRQMYSSAIKMKNTWAESSTLAMASNPYLKECREPCKFKGIGRRGNSCNIVRGFLWELCRLLTALRMPRNRADLLR